MSENDLLLAASTKPEKMADPFIRACLILIVGPMRYESLSISDIASENGWDTNYVKRCLSVLRRELLEKEAA